MLLTTHLANRVKRANIKYKKDKLCACRVHLASTWMKQAKINNAKNVPSILSVKMPVLNYVWLVMQVQVLPIKQEVLDVRRVASGDLEQELVALVRIVLLDSTVRGHWHWIRHTI